MKMSPTSSEQSAHKALEFLTAIYRPVPADSDHRPHTGCSPRIVSLPLVGLSPYLAVLTLCLVPFLTYKYLAVLFAAVILLTLVRGQWKKLATS